MSFKKISFYAAASRGVKLLSAPVTLLFISKYLSSEEIGFYYTFFSLISIQQLAELGLGHTLKQFIAHAYHENEGSWSDKSKLEIKNYIIFGLKWFSIVSLFVLFFVGPLGFYYYAQYSGPVEWKLPWVFLVIVISFTTFQLPFLIVLEAIQKQVVIYRAQTLSALINSICICLFLLNDFSLFTIGLSLFVSNLFLFLFILPHLIKLHFSMQTVIGRSNFKEIFIQLWPLFSKVAIVWGCGVLFWNGFNLVSFKIFDAEFAGKLIFSISLAKAGFGIAESVLQAQTTVIANKLATGEKNVARKIYQNYYLFSILFLILGYIFYIIVHTYFPSFYLFDKTVDINSMISIFIFFIILLLLTSNNNYIRCFKVEPFVYVSLFHSTMVPLTFYYFNSFGYSLLLYPSCIVLFISLLFSRKIARKYI